MDCFFGNDAIPIFLLETLVNIVVMALEGDFSDDCFLHFLLLGFVAVMVSFQFSFECLGNIMSIFCE